MKRLENKVVVIAGAATGIGAACAKRYIAEGAKVVIGDLNIDGAKKVAEALGPNAAAVEYNAADEATIKNLIDWTASEFGTINILHNNTALTSPTIQAKDTTIHDIPLDVWNMTMNINVTSFLLASKFAIPYMLKAGGGSIINTASLAGCAGNLGLTAYAVSKAAVISLTQQTAVQYGKQGIRCNAIAPGPVMTDVFRSHPGLVDMLAPHALTPTLGEAKDIASVAAFLASDDANYITGQVIAVDGGSSAHHPQYADEMKMSAHNH